MSYTPDWTNANAQGRLDPGVHAVCLSDAEEMVEAINRRRLLTYQGEQDFSSHIQTDAYVRASTMATVSSPPFDNFRESLDDKILSPPLGTLGGQPPTPTGMDWLLPVAGDDENEILVSGVGGVPEGKVGLFQKLNGADYWTDPVLTAGDTPIRDVQWNEPRQAVEWIRRGRWELPVYYWVGINSMVPDTPWIGEVIANNGGDELRTIGFAAIRTFEDPVRGLTNVTVRSNSYLQLTADKNCTAEVHACLRPIDFETDRPTWNEYNPAQSWAWSSPGGLGTGDSTPIGSIELTAGTPGNLSGAALTSALQAMVDGAEQNFLVRRVDTDVLGVVIESQLFIEFDLDTPPN